MAAKLIEFPVEATKAGRATDPDLAARAADGHTDAFETLVRRYQSTVRGMLLRLTGNAADADDLAQSTFLKAWSQISSYGGGQFRSWLCTIAYREFLQDVRRQTSRKTLAQTLENEPEVTTLSDVSGLSHDLDRALAKLPDNQRIAVTLCVGAGLSHGEAAIATGWPLGTVKSHVNRGKAALKDFLVGYGVA
ncbi:MAG: RNA polymerase sigma factor [Pseudomonadota bacterium]